MQTLGHGLHVAEGMGGIHNPIERWGGVFLAQCGSQKWAPNASFTLIDA